MWKEISFCCSTKKPNSIAEGAWRHQRICDLVLTTFNQSNKNQRSKQSNETTGNFLAISHGPSRRRLGHFDRRRLFPGLRIQKNRPVRADTARGRRQDDRAGGGQEGRRGLRSRLG